MDPSSFAKIKCVIKQGSVVLPKSRRKAPERVITCDQDKYTLERTSPDRQEAIAKAIASGMSVRQICREFRCNCNTVTAVKLANGHTIQKAKEEQAAKWATIIEMAQERLLSQLMDDDAKINAQQLSVIGGIGTDKMMLLGGEATSRVAHESVESPAKVRAAIKEALLAAKAQEKGKIPRN
ncbi:MAG: hypothetical protein CMO74_11565 [Verrucomicrobiales bacterium]|nr:hypothetical protein [Verrucomicrobiales bacterium]